MTHRFFRPVLYVLLSLVPLICLIVVEAFPFPYVTGKNFIFRILIEIIFALWVIARYFDLNLRTEPSRMTKTFFVFIAAMAVSGLVGENSFRSFWSNLSRMGGFITYLHLFAYYIVLTSVLKSEKSWRDYLRVSMIVSVAVSVHAFLQALGESAVVSIDRPDATFGNPAYLAIYLAFHVIFGFLLMTGEKDRKNLFIFGTMTSVNVFGLFLTQTRSAVLALSCGLVLFFSLLVYRQNRQKIKATVLKFTFVLIFSSFLITAFKFIDPAGHLKTDRILKTSLHEKSVQSRLFIWQLAQKAFFERPILGWGQENFIYTFKHYQPAMWDEPWADRAHNNLLEWLVSGGVVGGVCYLLLFGIPLWLIWVKPRKPELLVRSTSTHHTIRAGVTGLLVCYFVNSIFIFDQITTLIILAQIFALTYFIEISNDEMPQANSFKRVPYYHISAVLVFLGFILYQVNFKPMLYLSEFKNVISESGVLNKNQNGITPHAINRLVDKKVFYRPEIREHLIISSMLAAQQGSTEEALQKIYQQADEELNIELKRDPKNLYLKQLGLRFYTQFNQYDQANALAQQALQISPVHQITFADLGQMHLKKGDLARTADAYLKVYELDSTFPMAQVYRSAGLIYKNQINDAKRSIQNLEKIDTKYALHADILLAWLNTHQLGEVKEMLVRKEKEKLIDATDFILLGQYFLIYGQKEKAMQSLTEAKRLGYSNSLLLQSLIEKAR